MNPNPFSALSRRQALVCALAVGATTLSKSIVLADGGPVSLRPRPVSGTIRVRLEMEVKGNAHLAKNPLVDRKVEMKLPVASESVFDYEERLAPANTGPLVNNAMADHATDAAIRSAERYYHEAGCDAKLNKSVSQERLRDEVRHVVVRRENLPEVLFSNDGLLDRQEVELLRSPVSSVDVDLMMPVLPVDVGQTYFPTTDAIARVFNLSFVQKSELGVTVTSIDEQEAKFELKGKFEGSVDGVPTSVEAVGKMTFDRGCSTCTWLAVAVREQRDVGIAEPGFDLTATIKMLRKPMEQPVGLAKKSATPGLAGDIPANQLLVALTSQSLGIDMMMDRRWRVMSDIPGSAVIRMVDNDRSLAQCDFQPLPKMPENKPWTLEAFTDDVTRTLGSQMRKIVDKSQQTSTTGVEVLKVTAVGSASGVPIQWNMLHMTDQTGRRLLATFVMDTESAADFESSDVQMASSIRFRPIAEPSTTKESEKPAESTEVRVTKNAKAEQKSKARRVQ
jgi:hypothetical protein